MRGWEGRGGVGWSGAGHSRVDPPQSGAARWMPNYSTQTLILLEPLFQSHPYSSRTTVPTQPWFHSKAQYTQNPRPPWFLIFFLSGGERTEQPDELFVRFVWLFCQKGLMNCSSGSSGSSCQMKQMNRARWSEQKAIEVPRVIFAYFYILCIFLHMFTYLYIFLYILMIFWYKIDRVMDGGRLRRPPLISYQFSIKIEKV